MNYVRFLKEFHNHFGKAKKKEDKIFWDTSKIYFVPMNRHKCIFIRPYER